VAATVIVTYRRIDMAEKSLKVQVGGTHYKELGIEPWVIIEANKLNYWEGNALKYLLRRKPGVSHAEDLRKAIHHIEYLIEQEELKDER